MPLKHTPGKSTGIYRSGRWSANDPKSMARLLRKMNRSFDLEAGLKDIVQHAKRILRKHHLPVDRKNLPYIRRNKTAGIAQDADNALWQADFVRDWVSKGHAENAAMHGIRLGAAAERMQIRPFEPHAARGLKVLRGAQIGYNILHGDLHEKKEESARFQDDVNRKCNERPRLSFSSICKIVAGKHGVSAKTIFRRTDDPRVHCK